MASFGLKLNIGLAGDSFDRLVGSLPPGSGDNLTAELVVPSHTLERPVSFVVSNVTPNVAHIFHVTAEWGVPPTPTVTFVPNDVTAVVTLALAYGPNVVYIEDALGNKAYFRLAVTHYAAIFLAEATELTNFTWIPITNVQNAIASPVGHILANTFIGDVAAYIPNSLETLSTLGNKLLVKNFLWGPGTDRGVTELFAAFSASTPILSPMINRGTPSTFLYRNEESFAGTEVHTWLPNREVERWITFIRYLDNLPQIYTIKQINEGEVYVQVGNTVHKHSFDFESAFANTVLSGSAINQCFENLFRLDMSYTNQVMISFCEASYTLDGQMSPIYSPETDLLGERNFTEWSLTGRFEQQFDIADGIHGWVYDSPVVGAVDSINKFYNLTQIPASINSIKLFIDGLLLRLHLDYKISQADDFRSDVYILPFSLSPILIDAFVGEPRPFIAPVFSTVEIVGGADTEFLVTAGSQTLTDVTFVISEPPALGAQEARLHYSTPALPSGSYPAPNQYGTEALPLTTTTYSLVFPVAASSVDYQLLVQYGVDFAAPVPITPTSVSQLHHIVRNHTLTGATIELSAPVSDSNALLHWWLIEGNVGLETGTVTLIDGISSILIPFTSGPYLDTPIVIISLWNTTAVGSVALPFTTITNLNSVSFVAQFSEAISGSDYRLDYTVFPSEVGNFIEIFAPPQLGQIVEAQYDTKWEGWANTAPIQNVDGVTQEFTLPTACPIRESMYATLDGRLLSQGANKQYILNEDGVTLKLSFIPQAGQRLWCIYPTIDPFSLLAPTSVWNQGELIFGHTSSASFAAGKILAPSVIIPGDTVSIKDVVFTSVSTATGYIYNPAVIIPGHSLTFVELSITFTGVFNLLYEDTRTLGVIPDYNVVGDVFTLNSVGVFDNTLVYLHSTGTLPSGISPYTRYYIINVTLNTFQLSTTFSGAAILLLDAGTGIHTLETGALPTEFPVGVTRDDDAKALAAVINKNLGYYLATYDGAGTTTVKALVLSGSNSNQTLTTLPLIAGSIEATNILGDSFSFKDEVQTITFPVAPISGKWNLAFKGDVTTDIPFNVSSTALEGILRNISTLNTVEVSGTIGTEFEVTFAGVNGRQVQPLLSLYDIQKSFTPTDIAAPPILITNDQINGTNIVPAGRRVSQSFTATATGGLSTVYLWYYNDGHSPGASLRLNLSVAVGDEPGIIIGSTDTYLISGLNLFEQANFNFLITPLVTSGVKYCLETEWVVPSVGGDIEPVGSTTDVYAGGKAKWTYNGGISYFDYAAPDLAMEINYAVGVTGDAITILSHGFKHGDTVGFFTTGTLPAGLTVGTTYYVYLVDVNTIKLTTAPPTNVLVALIDAGVGVHTIALNTTGVVPNIVATVEGYGDRFPANITQEHDSLALAQIINANLIINKMYRASPITGGVGLTSIHVADLGTALIFSGSSMTSPNGIVRGAVENDIPFLTPKPFYYAEAPVVSLDGVSTTKYTGYSGNSIVFDSFPYKQAPYIVSQVFPLDSHPLDSMVANQPCSYPKGLFTQSLGSFLTTTEINYTETAVMAITTNGQPYQEAPTGAIDGINTVFDMTLSSCNGQNSMLLWVDGIFQDPTRYTYSLFMGHGRITLSFAPAVNQEIWVWYIIASDSCMQEYVVPLTGVVDGVNTNFSVPSSPWVDDPTLLVFNQGLLSLQDVDYTVDVGNTAITFATAPSAGFSLWAHFNQGTIGVDKWLQLSVGTGNGAQILWVFPTLLTANLPRSKDSVILALDGFVLRRGVDFTVNTNVEGNPNGFVTFVEAPGVGVKIQVAFFTRG